jgi:hypothetical protein
MRYFRLAPLFVYLVFSSIATVSARPLDQGTAIGDMTLGLVGPTAVPNLKLPVGGNGAASSAPSVPGAPALPGAAPGLPKTPKMPGIAGLPIRRSPLPEPVHGNSRLQPRIVRSADYSAASNSNATIPVEPKSTSAATKRETKKFRQGWVIPTGTSSPTQSASLAKRMTGRKSSKQHSSNGKHPTAKPPKSQKADPSKPQHAGMSDNSAPSSGPAAGLASLVKSVGATPKALSPAANSLPVLPGTPLTYADTSPTVDAVDDSAEQTAAKPVPVNEKEPAPGSNPGAYPSAPSYQSFPQNATVSASTSKSKRHSFVLDTDPLIPPSDETAAKKDPAMGLANIDSNQKPTPPPTPKVPVAGISTAATPSSTKTTPSPSMSIYQPTEPGYVGSYPTPDPTAA